MAEQRKEYKDLGEKEEHVACHGTALALAMTTRHVWKQRSKPDDLHQFYDQQHKPYVLRSMINSISVALTASYTLADHQT